MKKYLNIEKKDLKQFKTFQYFAIREFLII